MCAWLSKRLQTIVSMVPSGNFVADIGTGHGLTAVALAQTGRFGRIIATDKRENPLRIARNNAEKHHVENQIDFCLTDGFSGLDTDLIDTAILSGIGGLEMIDILKTCNFPISTLILQPQKSLTELRRFLSDHRYRISDEVLLVENSQMYIIMKAVRTDEVIHLHLVEQVAGPRIINDSSALAAEYLKSLNRRLHFQQIGNPALKAVKSEIERRIHEIEDS